MWTTTQPDAGRQPRDVEGDAKTEAESPWFWKYRDLEENSDYGPIALCSKFTFAEVQDGMTHQAFEVA